MDEQVIDLCRIFCFQKEAHGSDNLDLKYFVLAVVEAKFYFTLEAKQAAPASVLQLSILATVKSIPRPERYADLPVTVRLVAPGREQTVRAPIDIVAAIDRGVNAYRLYQEKIAVKFVVKKTLLPGDRLAIVPFDDDVAKDEEELVVMSADGKEKTLSTLDSLETGNGTRLSKPLERAEKVLHTVPKTCKENYSSK
jgi:hypothetical protein